MPFSSTARVITYTYDHLYRLTDADYSTGESFAYAYDAVGNRTVQTRTITSTTVTTYTYDDANRLDYYYEDGAQTDLTWDNNGNLLAQGTSVYTWDAANRLVSADVGGVVSSFAYNGLGQRTSQTVGGVTTEYVLDVATGLPEVIVATTGGSSTYYVQIQGQILAQHGSGAWTYILPDHLGSVRQLTNAAGQVALAQSYDPFGVLFEAAGSGASGFGYTGEQVDAGTELVFLRARYYDPATGRFLSKDPHPGSIYHPQTLTPYVYVLNNPINDRDLSGEQSENFADEFLKGVVYQFIDNNYTALGIPEQSRSLLRRGADEVAARHRDSLAFQLGRLTGSVITIGQAVTEFESGVTIMGCGAGGELLTWETGIGAVASGGVVAVGAVVTAHGVVVGVVSARNTGDIAGNIYWAMAEGGDGGPTGFSASSRPGYSGPPEGYTNKRPEDLDVALGDESRTTLQEVLASKDYENPSILIGEVDPSLKNTARYIYVIDKDGVIWMSRGGPHHPDLVGGANSYGAGEMFIDSSGRIVQIDNFSGHYLPSAGEFFPYMKHLLNSKGIQVPDGIFKPVFP